MAELREGSRIVGSGGIRYMIEELLPESVTIVRLGATGPIELDEYKREISIQTLREDFELDE